MVRVAPRSVLLVCLGFLCLAGLPAPSPAVDEAELARQLWEHGQEAMRQGRADEAVRCYRASLDADPHFFRNHLSLAAAYLDRGDQERACPHFALYLQACPDHLIVRAHYAELLLRLNRPDEARAEFARFVADAPEQTGQFARQLIHCHSRLMEIAEAEEDEYAEHLHRGIGLFLLARQPQAGRDGEDPPCPESLLCRAAAELTLARAERPDEAQPCWYLYEVWSRLAQRRAALRCLHDADQAAPFSYLTPTEEAKLALACRRNQGQTLPK
jgi:tetratricopeptide (TPR) repeat protein